MSTPSLSGTVLVTGANGGLGSAFSSAVLKDPQTANLKHLFTVRNPSTESELKKMLSSNGSSAATNEVLALDLGDLSSVRRVAADINARVSSGTLPPIRALVLNAGYQDAGASTNKAQHFTKDGIEMAFGVNHVAHMLLTLLLLQSMDKEYGRVVVVSSWTHDPADPQNRGGLYEPREEFGTIFPEGPDATQELARGVEWSGDGYKAGMRRYGVSKLCQVMFGYELQLRLSSDPSLSKIKVLAVDPGGMPTKLTRTSPLIVRLFTGYLMPLMAGLWAWCSPNGFLRPTWKSANDLMSAAFDDAPGREPLTEQHPSEMRYLNGGELKESSVESVDETKRRALWDGTLGLVGLKEGETALKDWK